jgi:hypothetical protein
MSGILDQMLQPEQFIPSSVDEYFALQLARRLDDDAAVGLYLHYVEHHHSNHLLNIYSKAKSHPEPAKAFHSALRPTEP